MILLILLYFGVIAFLAMYAGAVYGIYMFAKLLIQTKPDADVGIIRMTVGYAYGLLWISGLGYFVYFSTFNIIPKLAAPFFA